MTNTPTSNHLDDLDLPDDVVVLLERHRFDTTAFSRLRQQLAEGSYPLERNETNHTIEPPAAGDLLSWPNGGSDIDENWKDVGQQALNEGRVAVLILNGGMATRFGGVVKGIVEVLGGNSVAR